MAEPCEFGHVRAAVGKSMLLRDDSSVDDASWRIVESVSDTTSSMLSVQRI